MQIEIPDDLVKRATKAANWFFGKDNPEVQIVDILEAFIVTIDRMRKEEEAELAEKLKEAKK